MIPALAEFAAQSDSDVGKFVAIGTGLLVSFYYLHALVRETMGRGKKTEITPQPIGVQNVPASASRDEMEKIETNLHGRLKRERNEIDAQIRRAEDIAEKRADKLELKIDENTRLTERMSGQVGQMNQNIAVLTNTVTNFMRDNARKEP